MKRGHQKGRFLFILNGDLISSVLNTVRINRIRGGTGSVIGECKLNPCITDVKFSQKAKSEKRKVSF